jgi:hypothetical protein
MAQNNYYTDEYDRKTDGTTLPLVSTGTDSRRTYEWEVQFDITSIKSDGFSLAAKRVTGSGYKSNKITSERVNDKTHYAGKVDPDELTVVFDNLKDRDILNRLYKAMQGVYDPITGYFSKVGSYKGSLKVIQLDETRQPVTETRYAGAFILSWKPSDYDYAQNEFATITCTFSYDFVVQENILLFGPGF